jgi:hypothetical protein
MNHLLNSYCKFLKSFIDFAFQAFLQILRTRRLVAPVRPPPPPQLLRRTIETNLFEQKRIFGHTDRTTSRTNLTSRPILRSTTRKHRKRPRRIPTFTTLTKTTRRTQKETSYRRKRRQFRLKQFRLRNCVNGLTPKGKKKKKQKNCQTQDLSRDKNLRKELRLVFLN